MIIRQIVTLAALAIVYVASDMSITESDTPVTFTSIAPFIVIALVSGWSSLIFSIKRLHDQEKSAWWILLALIPFVGGIILFIILAFLPGTQGPNRYGTQPRTHASRP